VHVLVVVMFDISVRTAILQHCFWCSLFHFSWFRGGVKDQQIQTEISEIVAEHKHVQTGSVTSPPTSICWSSAYIFQFV